MQNTALSFSQGNSETSPVSTPDYFQSRTFSQVIEEGSASKPRLKIFGNFLREDTNTYFFSRTNTGKSLLAFQIGLAAATGISFDNCPQLRTESSPKKVLIVDLENEPITITNRHSLVRTIYDPLLLDNLVYLHEDVTVKPVFSYNMLLKIHDAAVAHKADLIILDNISRILPDLLKAEDVANVIECMKRIRQSTGASFLVIGHTTKTDARTAITPQSYYGSSMLQNFFQEIFFLDTAKDGNFFLCQAKTKYEERCIETVPLLSRGSHPLVGVGFSYQTMRTASDIQLPFSINTETKHERRDLHQFAKQIADLSKNNSCQEIADFLKADRRTIYRILEAYRIAC